MPPLFRLVRELEPHSVDWGLMARVVRSYKLHVGDDRANVYAMEVVLHDSEGTRIHASIRKQFIPRFASLFREEHVYAVKNFVVTNNDMRLRTTNAQYRLIFIARTVVTEVFDPQFTRSLYDFRMFDTLASQENVNEDVLVDVIGRLASRSALQVREVKGRQTSMVDISLENLQGLVLPCTLWGENAEMLHNYIEGRAEGVVVILQLCKAKMFKGEVRITNTFHVSKVIFNENVREIADFRRSMELEGRAVLPVGNIPLAYAGNIEEELQSSRDQIRTIDQLIAISEFGEFWIHGKIVALEPMEDWWYVSCKRCPRKMTQTGSTFYCDRCDIVDIIGTLRYCVKVRVADNKAMASFILWDKVCSLFIGKAASQLRATTYGKAVPDELRRFVGMSALFKVKVAEYFPGVNLGPFSVMNMTTNDNILQRFGNVDIDDIDNIKGKGIVHEFGAPMKAVKENFNPTEVCMGVKRCLMDAFGVKDEVGQTSKVSKKDEA